jgi:gas vesicle protein
MRLIPGFLIAAASALLIACGGGNPTDKLISHADKVLSIVESNKTDLDKAAKEVEAYMAANKSDIEKLAEDIKKWGEDFEAKHKDDPAALESFGKDMQAKMEKVEARMEALAKDVPGFESHEGLKKALGDMGSL